MRRIQTQHVLWAYAGLVVALSLYAALRTPIASEDNDQWFQISHGRYIVQEGRVPDTTYYSFHAPPRPWVDYAWIFQLLIYSTYAAAGYIGLIVLRAVLFAAFLAAIWRLLLGERPLAPTSLWPVFFFGLVAAHALDRFLVARPHVVSYLMIATFLAILERAPGKVYWLPLLAVLWLNSHGVVYPVLILIVLAYLGEHFLRRWSRRGRATRQDLRWAAALTLTMAAIFVTPHGLALLRIPFISTEYAAAALDELAWLPTRAFLGIQLSWRGLDHLSQSNLVMLAAVFCAALAAMRGRLRPSHLILLAGGIVLELRAIRLTHEAVLLALPLIAAGNPLESRGVDSVRAAAPAGRGLLAVLALALPVWILGGHLPGTDQPYPLSLRNLPHGVVRFLEQSGAAGPVMNNPNVGGYLQWALRPELPIFMNAEIPFPWVDEDLFEIGSAFFDAESLRKFLVRYRPAFIVAPLRAVGFPELIAAHPEYVAVFVDDTSVLYADARRNVALAREFALERLEPFRLAEAGYAKLGDHDRQEAQAEIERMLAIDPEICSLNQAAAILAIVDGNWTTARTRIDAAIAADPESARSEALLGDVLGGLGDVEPAVEAYRRALDLTDDDHARASIRRSLSRAYEVLGDDASAAESLELALGKFDVETAYLDLLHLGELQVRAGDLARAEKSLHFASVKTPPEDREARQRIADALTLLSSPPWPPSP